MKKSRESSQPAGRILRRVAFLFAVAGLALIIRGAALSPASAAQSTNRPSGAAAPAVADKVTICHGTNSVTNPYVVITVDKSSTTAEGHASHTGPVASSQAVAEGLKATKQAWGDIIPPFPLSGVVGGLNWTTAGQAIWANGCNYVTQPPTTPSSTFTVNKVYSPPGPTTPVAVTLTCTGGTVTNNPQNASPATPAQFTITGVATTCTATEQIPSGYTSTGSCSGTLANGTGSCTITNTRTLNPSSGTFTVNKVYSPPGPTTPVAVTLTCTGGTVTNNPQNASPATPAQFTITGVGGGASCSAAESPIPTGYTATGCTTPVAVPGSCTITNTLNTLNPSSGTFTVNKVYSPTNSGPAVSITLNCPNSSVANNQQSASPGSPAVFTVTSIQPNGTTCTATEQIPNGYTSTGPCSGTLAPNGTGACTIINTPITGFTPPFIPPTIFNPPPTIFNPPPTTFNPPPTTFNPPPTTFNPPTFSAPVTTVAPPAPLSEVQGLTSPPPASSVPPVAEVQGIQQVPSAFPRSGSGGYLNSAPGQGHGSQMILLGVVMFVGSLALYRMGASTKS